MEAEFHGVSSQTGRISTTKNGVALFSDGTSAWRIVLSTSWGSYSVMAMQKPVHRNWKEFITSLKTVSGECGAVGDAVGH